MTPLAVTPISRSSENFEEVSEIIFISDFEVCPISYHRSSKSFPKTTNTMSTSGLGLRNLNEIAFRFSVGIDQRRWQLSESNSGFRVNLISGFFFRFLPLGVRLFFSFLLRPKKASWAVTQPLRLLQSWVTSACWSSEKLLQKFQQLWQSPRQPLSPILCCVKQTDLWTWSACHFNS